VAGGREPIDLALWTPALALRLAFDVSPSEKLLEQPIGSGALQVRNKLEPILEELVESITVHALPIE
jgi:hypothetical protein